MRLFLARNAFNLRNLCHLYSAHFPSKLPKANDVLWILYSAYILKGVFKLKNLFSPKLKGSVPFKDEVQKYSLGKIMQRNEFGDGKTCQKHVRLKHSTNWYSLCDLKFISHCSPEGMVGIRKSTNCMEERNKIYHR